MQEPDGRLLAARCSSDGTDFINAGDYFNATAFFNATEFGSSLDLEGTMDGMKSS
jgi:hypothetical protein